MKTTHVVLACCVGMACGGSHHSPTVAAPDTFVPLTLRECLHDLFPEVLDVGGRRIPVTAAGQMPETSNVPEFNDCQKFVIDTSGTLEFTTGFFAILAADSLETLETRLQNMNRHAGLAAARIYAEEDYEPLGIKQGNSCLYLYRSWGTEESRWSATLVWVGGYGAPCSPLERADSLGTQLTVRSRAFPGLDDRDYPPVTRWEWDNDRSRQFMGVKCGAAWCEISQSGEVSSPAYRRELGTVVKGWYDEQLLAVKGEHGTLVPSNILGTIFPVNNLHEYDTDAFAGDWVKVADVWIREASSGPQGLASVANSNAFAEYRQQYNFHRARSNGIRTALGEYTTPRDDDLNSVWLCFGAKADCPGVPADVTCPVPLNNEVQSGQWWGKVLAPASTGQAGEAKYKCMRRFSEEGKSRGVPGTARWRWHPGDDGWWTRCDLGCCEDGF